jgi:hypothetical protein
VRAPGALGWALVGGDGKIPVTVKGAEPVPVMVSFLVDALATYRLTRLVVEDRVPFGSLRDWITDRWPSSLAAEWVGCAWCAGMVTAGGVTMARALLPRWWSTPAMVLACSAVTGLVTTWEQGTWTREGQSRYEPGYERRHQQ